MQKTPDGIRRQAVFDPAGRYRYSLRRRWDAAGARVAFVLLNPSTADGRRDDPTIRRCIGFAREWGFGGLEVVNLFAHRSNPPRRPAQRARPGRAGKRPLSGGGLGSGGPGDRRLGQPRRPVGAGGAGVGIGQPRRNPAAKPRPDQSGAAPPRALSAQRHRRTPLPATLTEQPRRPPAQDSWVEGNTGALFSWIAFTPSARSSEKKVRNSVARE